MVDSASPAPVTVLLSPRYHSWCAGFEFRHFSWSSLNDVEDRAAPLGTYGSPHCPTAHGELGCSRGNRPRARVKYCASSACSRYLQGRRRLHSQHQGQRRNNGFPRLCVGSIQLRIWQGVAVSPVERNVSKRTIPQSQGFLQRAILRPLPPGGLPPVASVSSFQRLP